MASDSNHAGQGPTEQELKEAFNMVDKNGDGSISTQELKTVMGAMGQKTSEEDIKALMKKVDIDKNNSISFQEFVTMMKTMKPDPEKQLRDQFKLLDKDSDGYISIVELKDLTKAMGEGMISSELEDMMKEMDENGDAKLDYEEFKKIMTF